MTPFSGTAGVVLAATCNCRTVLHDTGRLQNDWLRECCPRLACFDRRLVDGVGRGTRLRLDPARASFSFCAVMTISLIELADEFPESVALEQRRVSPRPPLRKWGTGFFRGLVKAGRSRRWPSRATTLPMLFFART